MDSRKPQQDKAKATNKLALSKETLKDLKPREEAAQDIRAGVSACACHTEQGPACL